MKIICTIVLFLVTISCSRTIILDSIVQEMACYPESSLQDLYKSWFQSVYGPGHLLKDTVDAYRYFKEELNSTENYTDTVYWRPLGKGDRFGRLNLYLVSSGIIPEKEFFLAFIRSSQEFDLPETKEWHKKWSQIFSIIENCKFKPLNYTRDLIFIDSLLYEGKYAVHHSNRYTELYNPHYRVVSIKEYKKLKKKYL